PLPDRRQDRNPVHPDQGIHRERTPACEGDRPAPAASEPRRPGPLHPELGRPDARGHMGARIHRPCVRIPGVLKDSERADRVTALLYLAPALLVLLSLWLGRYPGEQRILAFTSRTRARRARAATRARRWRTATLPRGGRLLAASL